MQNEILWTLARVSNHRVEKRSRNFNVAEICRPLRVFESRKVFFARGCHNSLVDKLSSHVIPEIERCALNVWLE